MLLETSLKKGKLLTTILAAIILSLFMPSTLTYAAGTIPVAVSPTLTRCPSGMTQWGEVLVGDTMFFAANDGTHGCSLWKSDGTASATSRVKDFPNSLGPISLTNVNGTLFFMTSSGSRQELWKSDGTTTGTVLVATVNASAGLSSGAPLLTNANGIVLFNVNTATNANPSVHLWRSDGTAEGTFQLSDVRIVANPGTSLNNVSYFIGYDSTHGEELWRSDGTAEGTHLVADINPGNAGSQINYNALGQTMGFSDFKVFNNSLYFTAFDGTHDQEIWKSDGTISGTSVVTDLNPCAPFILGVTASDVLFTNGCGGQSAGIWKTDGTSSAALKISDVEAPISQETATINDILYFVARDSSHGYELWRTDGNNTNMVKDIYPGNNSFLNATRPVVFDNTLYFTANDGVHGNELWQSNGTEEGTTMVVDLTPGSGSNSPAPNIVFNNTFFFSTSSGSSWEQGWKLWTFVDTFPAPTNLTAASPTNLPVLSWSVQTPADHYDIYRNGVKIASTTSLTYSDTTAQEGNVNYYVVGVNMNSMSDPSNTITVLVDKTSPEITTVTWTTNPLLQGQTTTVQVAAQDTLSGISNVWYTVEGNSPQPMSLNPQTGRWEATFGSTLAVNTYAISFMAEDNAQNMSAATSDVLAVYNAANGYVTGHEWLLPSESDTLPIVRDTSTNNPTTLVIGLTNVKAATSTTPTSGSFDIQYVIKNKKDAFSLSSNVISWLVVPDNEHASILGEAELTTYVDGMKTVTQNVPVRIDLSLGSNGNPDHVMLRIYDPGVDPNTASPSYIINDDALSNSHAMIHQ